MKGLWLGLLVAIGGLFGGAALAQGVTLHIACGAVGPELQICKDNVNAWAQQTGNKVIVVSTPNSSTDRLALYQQYLGAQSDAVDVYQIDVVWPGILGDYFVDLGQYLPDLQSYLKGFIPSLVANDNVGGKQIALPWFNDLGILFYRTDLLKKYGFDSPPQTWAQLQAMAKTIQDGERAAGNDKFWGFVWQGNAYEGLTCDALEWIYSNGGGQIVNAQGDVTVNNPNAVAALQQAAGWVGTISPPGVTTYQEEDARGVFQAGNAAFMRNWPYAIATGESADSPIKGKFAVAPLPEGSSSDARHTATIGGWQLAVSRFSKHPKEAAELAKFLTSEQIEKMRVIQGGFLPSRPNLYNDADVVKAQPWIANIASVAATAVTRPAGQTGHKYNQVSSAFFTAVHNVLTGQQQAAPALAALEQQLKRIKGAGW